MKIITKQLAKHLPKQNRFNNYNLIDPSNFDELYRLLSNNKINSIQVIDATAIINREEGENTYFVHQEIQKIMDNHVGIVREEKELKEGIQKLEEI